MTKKQFADPLSDVGFKMMFSDEEIMRNLLGALIPELTIKTLTYLNPKVLGDALDDIHYEYDLLVETQDGKYCVVEMQRVRQKHFNYRAVLYLTYLIQMQAKVAQKRQFDICDKAGKERRWDYRFESVYLLGILEDGWGPKEEKDGEELLERYRFRNVNTQKDLDVDVNVLFLQLGRFHKGKEEVAGIVEQYAWSLKNMKESEAAPVEFGDERILKLFKKSSSVNKSALYTKLLKAKEEMTTRNDYLNAIDYAKELAMEEGLAKGRAEGEDAARLATAKNFKVSGVAVDIIVKCTGLTAEQVAAL